MTDTPVSERVPTGAEIAPAYDRLIQLADDHLERPVSTRLRTWEDGEIEIRVWHKYGHLEPGMENRDILRYHSKTETVELATVERDRETGDRTVKSRETVTTLAPEKIGESASGQSLSR